MNEIEKAAFAVRMVKELLSMNKKIKAVKLVRLLYPLQEKDLANARKFVDAVEQEVLAEAE